MVKRVKGILPSILLAKERVDQRSVVGVSYSTRDTTANAQPEILYFQHRFCGSYFESFAYFNYEYYYTIYFSAGAFYNKENTMMNAAFLYIAISVAIIALVISLRVIILKIMKIYNSETITFIKGDHKITVSKYYNRSDSKKLLQL